MKRIRLAAGIIFLAATVTLVFCFMKKETINADGFIPRSGIVVEDGKMTPEVLLAFGRMSDPQMSPDGEYILYGVSHTSVPENRSCRNLYISTKDGSESWRITTSGKSISNARWSADGSRIVFLMGGQIWSSRVKRSGDNSLATCRQESVSSNCRRTRRR